MNESIQIQNRKISLAEKPFVIAEIGINHEGSLEKAMQMVKDAHLAGCECVKFQCHVIEDEMIPNNVIPGNASESIWNIMDRCKLSLEDDQKLKTYTESLGMHYLSTPFSRAAADRLESMNVHFYKIGSGECNNYPLIEHICQFKKPIILSTGMNDLNSIKPAVKLFKKYKIPYALLHCTSMYPTPYKNVRLGAMTDLQREFPHAIIGLSDHSIGNYTCFASVALGGRILEKHFTSNKSWPGPDISISITPDELKDLIIGSNAIFEALGGKKSILKEEQPTIDFAYASCVSLKNIKKGDPFTTQNLWVKRPGTGKILAKDFHRILGKKASRNILENEQISWEDII